MSSLKDAYTYHRKISRRVAGRFGLVSQPCTAHEALALARADVAAGRTRYPERAYGPGTRQTSLGKPNLLGLHDDTGQGAFRHVGDVLPYDWRNSTPWNRGDASGWYTDPHGDVFKDGTGLCWGVVYQLPGRARRSRFVAGYQFGGVDQGITLDLSTIYEGEPGEPENVRENDAARDAARRADRLAERAAKEERAYQEASSARLEHDELGEAIKELRQDALALIGEARAKAATLAGAPLICATLRASVKRIRSEILSNRSRMRELEENYSGAPGWCDA